MVTANSTVKVGNVTFSNSAPLALIAGPCQMETRDHAFEMAGRLKEMTDKLGIGLVYKSSFDKANRTSLKAARGIGLEKALEVFSDLKKEYGFPVLTDIHTEEQCAAVAPVVDVLQIPAFLCRQTDLLIAAARTGRVVNVKKGQFLAPWDMKNVLAKITESGNPNVLATERGVSFGYNTLVSDMRALPIMAGLGAPVILMRLTPSSSRAGRAVLRVGSVNSSKRWRVPQLQWAWRASSSKPTKIPIMLRPTAPTWCRSTRCRRFWKS